MKDLTKFKEQLLVAHSKTLKFFEPKGSIKALATRSVYWAGGSYEEFLAYAEKVDAKLVYYSEVLKEHPKHRRNIAYITLGFVHNDIMHLYNEHPDFQELRTGGNAGQAKTRPAPRQKGKPR